MSRKASVWRRVRSVLTLRAQIRALAAFSLLLLLGQHVAPGLHQLAEPHEVCPEHGELVHEGELARSENVPREGRTISGGASGHEHGHCALAAAAIHEGQALLAAPGFAPFEPHGRTETQILSQGLIAPKTALFRLAPKQSPPA